jgi:hypothetical protein
VLGAVARECHLTTNLNSNPDGVIGNCKFNSAVQGTTEQRGIRSHGDTLAAQWAALDEHFQNHIKLVERFRDAGPEVVARMWMRQTNESGHSVSQFERDALIERYCELFGTWPDLCPARNELRSGLPAAELERADLCIDKAKQHIADQRRGSQNKNTSGETRGCRNVCSSVSK